ncbi:SNF2 family N-terminal domain-containing protein [Aspergillus stella-maris]|uniref:SNF2 family N-terminal domain-containing protein n=1 Tax=Aspergillus stella-maris TaxID=1810926 RepID=UPI003CCE0E94
MPNAPWNLSTNVIEEAHASFEVPALEGFTATKRKEAMNQMILSIPSADQEGAKNDAILLLNSLRKFNNRVQSDGDGCWKIKGLKTGIYNYQVIGCAFMRDRENSPDEPRGGILAVIMGFGKTLQALVNIMDGAPSDPDDPVRTTLLIVPSHLIQHWTDQILKHCELETIDRVVDYHAAARLATLNDIEDLQSYSIVITTYEEVRRSYPTFKPPKELANEDTLREQWKQIFEEKRGPLHHIKFHRIIADEAHAIKNWKSSFSIAVRALTARHKWLLSGTPVTNWSDEFYPLLSFLDVPGAGKYRDFLSYYRCGETANERLHNLLRAYMLRRTHASRFMARPIISLPDIKEIKHEVEFSEAEWLIYNAIKFMFIESINCVQPQMTLWRVQHFALMESQRWRVSPVSKQRNAVAH